MSIRCKGILTLIANPAIRTFIGLAKNSDGFTHSNAVPAFEPIPPDHPGKWEERMKNLALSRQR
jgi:hypothetical protein